MGRKSAKKTDSEAAAAPVADTAVMTPIPATVGKGKGKKAKKPVTAAKAAKVAKRRSACERAGIHISEPRIRRIVKRSWQGHVSKTATVAIASFLQYIDADIITKAAEVASKEGPNTRITSAHIQSALSANPWLRDSGLIRGYVLGAAPMTTYEVNDSE